MHLQAEGPEFVQALLSDNDMRVRYHAAAFLQRRLQAARPQVGHLLYGCSEPGTESMHDNSSIALFASSSTACTCLALPDHLVHATFLRLLGASCHNCEPHKHEVNKVSWHAKSGAEEMPPSSKACSLFEAALDLCGILSQMCLLH